MKSMASHRAAPETPARPGLGCALTEMFFGRSHCSDPSHELGISNLYPPQARAYKRSLAPMAGSEDQATFSSSSPGTSRDLADDEVRGSEQ
jgi:hypothetical protein